MHRQGGKSNRGNQGGEGDQRGEDDWGDQGGEGDQGDQTYMQVSSGQVDTLMQMHLWATDAQVWCGKRATIRYLPLCKPRFQTPMQV